ncbi:hypothetical protein MBLNU459_g3315t1 [Dothideomycetes sp. NU459]
MKFELALLSLLGLAVANPVGLREVQRRQYTGEDTENQLTDGTACREVTVLFARGTTESGNVGTTVGPAFFQAIVSLIGADNVAVQGVDYDASILGFLEGGSPSGSATLSSLIVQAEAQCPDTNLVVSGYSQGGQVVHNAANNITDAQAAFISSVVIFGDPDDGEAVGAVPASKTDIICHTGDDICLHGDLVLEPHLTYAEDAPAAAKFVVDAAGLS